MMAWRYDTGTPSEDAISQFNCSYQSMPLFNNSDVSGYQTPDRCEGRKRACGDEERWLFEMENRSERNIYIDCYRNILLMVGRTEKQRRGTNHGSIETSSEHEINRGWGLPHQARPQVQAVQRYP